jgi:hypothetical protein
MGGAGWGHLTPRHPEWPLKCVGGLRTQPMCVLQRGALWCVGASLDGSLDVLIEADPLARRVQADQELGGSPAVDLRAARGEHRLGLP